MKECIGDFRAPATHVTFHYDVAHELNSLRINKWDAHKAYMELFFRPVEVADRFDASDVARRLRCGDNSFFAENTVRVITLLLLDCCRRMCGRRISLEDLAFEDPIATPANIEIM
jgi:hypothetical protein